MGPLLFLVLLAFFASGQIFAADADYLFLGVRWVDVPKYPGDFGLLRASFYLADQHVDVSVALLRCGYVETVRLPSAGPGVVDVAIKLQVDRLGVSTECTLLFKSRYVSKGGVLRDGVEKAEYVKLEIPHYPSPHVRVVGDLVAGVRGTAAVVVTDVYSYYGSVEVSAAGARVYSPPVAFGDLANFTMPVEIVADGPGAVWTVVIRTRDALGREIVLTRQLPLPVGPRPLPKVYTDVSWLKAGAQSQVAIRVEYPFPVDGVVYVLGYSAPLVGGRGELAVAVVPDVPKLVLPVVVQLDTGAVDRVEISIPVYTVADGDFSVEVWPQVLNIGELSTVWIRARGRGEFTGQISVSGAVLLGQSPVFFRGVEEATVELRLIPTSSVVSIDVAAVAGGRLERRSAALVASQRPPFDVAVEPAEVPSGKSTPVKIRLYPRLNVTEASVTIWPGQNAVFPQKTAKIPPAGGEVEIEVAVPEEVMGGVVLNYRVVYTLASGVSGEYVGTLTLLATQSPSLDIELSVVPERPEAGKPFYLVVRLYNRAGVEARDVKTYIEGDVAAVRNPPPLGAVPPQGSKDATFTLVAEHGGRRPVEVVVEYRDRFGRVYTARRELVVDVANYTPPAAAAQERDRPPAAAVAASALAAVAAAIVVIAVKRGRVARTR